MLHIFSGEEMLVWDEIDREITNQYILCFVMQKLRSEHFCPSVSRNDFVLIQIDMFIFGQINSQFVRLSPWQLCYGHRYLYQKSHIHLLGKSQGTGVKTLHLYGGYMKTCPGVLAAT